MLSARCPSWSTLAFVLGCSLVFASFDSARADIVDFEDLSLSANSHFSGPDPGGTVVAGPWGPVTYGSFASGGATFSNYFDSTFFSWGGFAYSNETDTTTAGFGNQYSAFTGAAHSGSNFAVAFGYADPLNPANAAELATLPSIVLPTGALVQSMYVTNTTYAALSMLDGDAFADPFGGPSGDEQDWLLLTVYGTDSNGDPLAAAVEFYLADYRFADNGLDYVVDDWTLLDLSPLAGAATLYFNVTTSDVGGFGPNTPTYFAMDDLTFTTVPEPSTFALLASAAGLIGWLRRRSSTASPAAAA